MTRRTNASGPEAPPSTFAEVAPRSSDMPAYTNQVMFEMNATLGRLEVKIDNLQKSHDSASKKVDGVDDRLNKLEHKASLITGVLICAIFLVPTCAAIVWWSLGQRIEAALQMPQPTKAAPPVSTSPSSVNNQQP